MGPATRTRCGPQCIYERHLHFRVPALDGVFGSHRLLSEGHARDV